MLKRKLGISQQVVCFSQLRSKRSDKKVSIKADDTNANWREEQPGSLRKDDDNVYENSTKKLL